MTQPHIRREILIFNGAVAVSVAVSIIFIGQLLHLSSYGIDFSDEGYYLNWISNPWLYKVSITQFGFIYHPLYELLNENLVRLRQTNITLTFGLAWFSSFILCQKFNHGDAPRTGIYPQIGVSFVLATGSLVVFNSWLISPSYNSLALQSLLILTTGILLASPNSSPSSLVGWVFIGIGGYLALMAKPSTAAALALTTLIYLMFSRKLKLHLLTIAAITATALTYISALVIDGSIYEFVARNISGIENVARLSGENGIASIFRIDSFVLSTREWFGIAAIALLVFLPSYSALSNTETRRTALWLLALAGLSAAALFVAVYIHPTIKRTMFQGMWMCAPPIGILFASVLLVFTDSERIKPHENKRDVLVLMLFLVILPYVYAFGTNGNYWAAASEASIFWVLSGVMVILMVQQRPINLHALFAIAVGAQLITILLLHTGLEQPYRQPLPLRLNTETVHTLPGGSELILSRDFGQYINDLQQIATEGGLGKNDSIIDLTGHYPGAIYSLGAKSLGEPWLIGGYKGSEMFAVTALDRVSCTDLGHAWILLELSGPRHLDPVILKRYGMDIYKDFAVAGVANSPRGSYPESFKQSLIRPIRTPQDARIACEQARASK